MVAHAPCRVSRVGESRRDCQPTAPARTMETPRFQRFELKGLQNQRFPELHVNMSRVAKAPSKELVRAHRERRRAAGRVLVNTDLPAELVEAIDRLKVARGVRGRTPIIEEALRVYIETQQGT